jgi:hypothetical protein
MNNTKPESAKKIAWENMRYMIFYILAFSVALAFNNVLLAVSKRFGVRENIPLEIIFFLILFGITMYLAVITRTHIEHVPTDKEE